MKINKRTLHKDKLLVKKNSNKILEQFKKINKKLLNDNTLLYNYNELPNIINYISSDKTYINNNCHLGQRKLLLTEIEFYSKFVDRKKNNIILYAGSAACEHLTIILRLFPNLKFILIDPNYHLINDYDFKYIYQNVEVIERINTRDFKNMLNKKTHFRDIHLNKIAVNLKTTSFLNLNKTFDVINNVYYENKNYIKEMNKIKKAFYTKNYKNLLSQIKKSKTRVFIIQDYLTIKLTKLLKEVIDEVYFLTDIRTAFFMKKTHDLDILWNSALQIIFLKILKPVYSMLKFRPVYFVDRNDKFHKGYNLLTNNKNSEINFLTKQEIQLLKFIKIDLDYVKKNYNIDLIENYNNNKYYYLDNNHIFLQPWAPKASGEVRLFVDQKTIDNKYILYDNIEWENKFYYFKFYRQHAYHSLFYNIIKKYNIDYDGSYDCSRELMILCNYFTYNNNVNKTIEFDNICKFLKERENVRKIKKLFKDINKITFYNFINNNKCPYFGNIKNKKNNLTILLYNNKFNKINKYLIDNNIYSVGEYNKDNNIIKKLLN